MSGTNKLLSVYIYILYHYTHNMFMMVYVRLCLFLYIQLNGVFLLSFAEFHLQNTTDMTDMAYTTL